MLLRKLLRPASIAVIGASPRSFMGSVVLANLRAMSFPGDVFAVNPKRDDVMGYPTVPAVQDIDASIDLAIVQIGAAGVGAAIKDAAAAGVRNFVVPGAGFTDSGEVATKLVADLQAMQRSLGIQVVGPNAMGIVDLVTGATPYVGTVPDTVRRGSVAVVSQSGAVVEAFVNSGGRVPMSTAVSTGSEATVDVTDYLEFFATDPETSAVLMFIEGVRQPERLLAALARLEEVDKRVAALLVGKSDVAQSGIVSHSGRLAPNYRVTRAAFSQAGVVVVDDLDELMAVGELFAAGVNSIGNRVAVVVNSGGEGNMLADIAADCGVDLPLLSSVTKDQIVSAWPRFRPSNPLDPWGVADYKDVYPMVIASAVAEDVDVVIVAQDQQVTAGVYEQRLGLDLARYLAEACKGSQRTPVFLSPTSQDPPKDLVDLCQAERIALLRGAGSGLRAIGRLARRRWSLLPYDDTNSQPAQIPEIDCGVGVLDEVEALNVLERFGVATPDRVCCSTHDECVEAASTIGYPLVLKGVGGGVAHKTELGLVHVGIADESQLRTTLEEIDIQRRHPRANSCYLVAEQIRGDLELLVGFHRDDTFGATTVVGLGGIWAEALDVTALRVGVIDPELALAMIDERSVGRMLREARGGSLAIDSVVEVICTISRIGHENPTVTSIEVNPLIVSRSGAVAVDGLITTAEPKRQGRHEDDNS